MNKSEFVYVIVRLIGVIFLPYAGLVIPTLLGALMLVWDTSVAKAPMLDTIIRVAIGLVIGLYLLVDGNLLFSIFDREG